MKNHVEHENRQEGNHIGVCCILEPLLKLEQVDEYGRMLYLVDWYQHVFRKVV